MIVCRELFPKLVVIVALVVTSHVPFTWWCSLRRGILRRQAPSTECARSTEGKVSVLVPAWREASTIPRCLRALNKVTYSSFEILIVAGGDDGTYGAVQQHTGGLQSLRLIRQNEGGKNAALNQGFAASKGEAIVLLDADTEVSSGRLRALVAPLDGRIQATGGAHPASRHPRRVLAQRDPLAAGAFCLPAPAVRSLPSEACDRSHQSLHLRPCLVHTRLHQLCSGRCFELACVDWPPCHCALECVRGLAALAQGGTGGRGGRLQTGLAVAQAGLGAALAFDCDAGGLRTGHSDLAVAGSPFQGSPAPEVCR